MSDILERLREAARGGDVFVSPGQAADEIEKLRAALRPFADVLQGHYHHQVSEMPIVAGYHKDDLRFKLTLGDFRKARAALGEKE